MVNNNAETSLVTLLILAIPTLITSISSLIASLKNASQIKEVKIQINGRLNEMIELTQEAYHALGVKEERERQDKLDIETE